MRLRSMRAALAKMLQGKWPQKVFRRQSLKQLKPSSKKKEVQLILFIFPPVNGNLQSLANGLQLSKGMKENVLWPIWKLRCLFGEMALTLSLNVMELKMARIIYLRNSPPSLMIACMKTFASTRC